MHEGSTDIGDINEGSANTTDGGSSEFTGFVMSCWTILEKDEPTSKEWNIFKKDDQNIMAIVSTPSKVCKFLNKALETKKGHTKRRFPFHPVEHRGVNYGNTINPTKSIDAVPFNKDAKFIKQSEYRFVLTYAFPEIIDSFIFCGGIDYMESCFVNPTMCKKQKKELQPIILYPGDGYGDFSDKNMGEILANEDILFE